MVTMLSKYTPNIFASISYQKAMDAVVSFDGDGDSYDEGDGRRSFRCYPPYPETDEDRFETSWEIEFDLNEAKELMVESAPLDFWAMVNNPEALTESLGYELK